MALIKHKWVVFVASIVVSFFNYGFPSSMGAMYIGMLDTFNAGRARTALVHSLLITFCWVFGVISGFLISKFSITIVTHIAALLSAIGFLASYFATSIYQLYGFISVVAGMAFATMYISAVVCVGWTFTGRQKSMVLALQSVGTAISGFMWPNLLTASIEAYSLRGAFLILCGIFLNNIPVAIIFSNCDISVEKSEEVGQVNKGFDMSSPENVNSKENSTFSDNKAIDNSLCNTNAPQKGYVYGTEYKLNDSKTINLHAKIEEINNSLIKKETAEEVTDTVKTNDIIIENKGETNSTGTGFKKVCFNKLGCLYVIYVLAGVLNMSTLAGFLSVYQDINVYNGLTISQSDYTFMSYALLNIISRFLPLVPARFPRINSFTVPVLSSLCGGIGQLILLTNTSFTSTILAMAFTAVSDGGWVASMQAILFEILPHQYQATGFGFMLTAMGIAAAATGPMFGSIRDATSSYQGVLVITTAMLFTSAFIDFVCLLMSLKMKQNNYTVNDQVTEPRI